MSILCTGSIAIDNIMVFHDHFKNHIIPERVHSINVSFFVPSLDKRWGGTGANIAYNLRILGIDPILLGTVGSDFAPYAAWLDANSVRRNYIKVLDDVFTAQCFITTDLDNNQITSFHPGAMERAHEATLDSVDEDFSLGIVAPNGKQAMLDIAAGLKQRGTPCVVDPGQSLPIFEADELLVLLDGAAVYVVNDYEWALTQEKTGLDEDAIAERVGALIVTRGARGSMVRKGSGGAEVRMESDRSEIDSISAAEVVDPTGAGDAYRAGILYALLNDLPLETGAKIGSLMGSLQVALPGPQALNLTPAEFRERYEQVYGESF